MLGIVTPKSLAGSANAVRMAERRGPGNVYLSNLGRFDFVDRIGDWTLSGALAAGGISTIGYFLAGVNSSHGTLFWNFTYIEEIVSRERPSGAFPRPWRPNLPTSPGAVTRMTKLGVPAAYRSTRTRSALADSELPSQNRRRWVDH